jgi:hypothetical protein
VNIFPKKKEKKTSHLKIDTRFFAQLSSKNDNQCWVSIKKEVKIEQNFKPILILNTMGLQ